jgi:hypothetical protein
MPDPDITNSFNEVVRHYQRELREGRPPRPASLSLGTCPPEITLATRRSSAFAEHPGEPRFTRHRAITGHCDHPCGGGSISNKSRPVSSKSPNMGLRRRRRAGAEQAKCQ